MNAHCSMCDERGLAEILPETKTAHATLTRCPHNAAALVAIKHRIEQERAYNERRRRPRPHNNNDDDEVF